MRRQWRIGRSVRSLRRRKGWRQVDLAARIGCSRQVISRIESDRLDNVMLGTLAACIAELDGYLRTDVLWQGERLPRLMDARHAALQNAFVLMLERFGWQVRVEVSFSEYGERGRIDVLAFHPPTKTLAVVEVKPDIGDAQDTVGRLDVKVRLAPKLARELGWIPAAVVAVLVLEDRTSPRRHVAEHPGLFRRFAPRGRAAAAWLRRPQVPMPSGLLLFLDV